MSAPKIVNVAVGILMRPDGQVLLGQRPAGKPYEGWWEFPGGKFEPGEDAAQAAVRELEESGLRGAFYRAAEACSDKAKELG